MQYSCSKEYTYLREKTAATLAKYYESRKHLKKNLQAGGFSDLRREIQTKTHINIGPDLDGYKGEVSACCLYRVVLMTKLHMLICNIQCARQRIHDGDVKVNETCLALTDLSSDDAFVKTLESIWNIVSSM